MHLKCLVVDAQIVITGTANWTQQAFNANFEDTLLITSPELAEQYLAKMDELAGVAMPVMASASGRTFPVRFPQTPPVISRVPSGGINAPRARTFSAPLPEVVFTPDTNWAGRLIEQLTAATNRIDVAMYLLSEDSLIENLLEKAAEGICAVRIFVDVGMERSGTLNILQRFADAGAEVRVFGGDRENLHHKFVVVDDRYIWTGSANWTVGAITLNVEDVLFFDAPEIAQWYRKWADEMAKVCKPFVALQRPVATPETVATPASRTWYTGLPPSTSRTNWTRMAAHQPHPPLATEAFTQYVPDETYPKVVLELLRSAQQTILISMYKIAKPGDRLYSGLQGKILSELEKAVARGVYVGMLLYLPSTPQDALYKAHSTWAEELRRRGMDVRLGLPTVTMHEKTISVDQYKVLTGSHNWTEGSIDGTRVLESSALVIFPEPQRWIADYFFSRPMLQDMSSRENWEREAMLVRQASSLKNEQLEEFVDAWTADEEEVEP